MLHYSLGKIALSYKLMKNSANDYQNSWALPLGFTLSEIMLSKKHCKKNCENNTYFVKTRYFLHWNFCSEFPSRSLGNRANGLEGG